MTGRTKAYIDGFRSFDPLSDMKVPKDLKGDDRYEWINGWDDAKSNEGALGPEEGPALDVGPNGV